MLSSDDEKSDTSITDVLKNDLQKVLNDVNSNTLTTYELKSLQTTLHDWRDSERDSTTLLTRRISQVLKMKNETSNLITLTRKLHTAIAKLIQNEHEEPLDDDNKTAEDIVESVMKLIDSCGTIDIQRIINLLENTRRHITELTHNKKVHVHVKTTGNIMEAVISLFSNYCKAKKHSVTSLEENIEHHNEGPSRISVSLSKDTRIQPSEELNNVAKTRDFKNKGPVFIRKEQYHGEDSRSMSNKQHRYGHRAEYGERSMGIPRDEHASNYDCDCAQNRISPCHICRYTILEPYGANQEDRDVRRTKISKTVPEPSPTSHMHRREYERGSHGPNCECEGQSWDRNTRKSPCKTAIQNNIEAEKSTCDLVEIITQVILKTTAKYIDIPSCGNKKEILRKMTSVAVTSLVDKLNQDENDFAINDKTNNYIGRLLVNILKDVFVTQFPARMINKIAETCAHEIKQVFLKYDETNLPCFGTERIRTEEIQTHKKTDDMPFLNTDENEAVGSKIEKVIQEIEMGLQHLSQINSLFTEVKYRKYIGELLSKINCSTKKLRDKECVQSAPTQLKEFNVTIPSMEDDLIQPEKSEEYISGCRRNRVFEYTKKLVDNISVTNSWSPTRAISEECQNDLMKSIENMLKHVSCIDSGTDITCHDDSNKTKHDNRQHDLSDAVSQHDKYISKQTAEDNDIMRDAAQNVCDQLSYFQKPVLEISDCTSNSIKETCTSVCMHSDENLTDEQNDIDGHSIKWTSSKLSHLSTRLFQGEDFEGEICISYKQLSQIITEVVALINEKPTPETTDKASQTDKKEIANISTKNTTGKNDNVSENSIFSGANGDEQIIESGTNGSIFEPQSDSLSDLEGLSQDILRRAFMEARKGSLTSSELTNIIQNMRLTLEEMTIITNKQSSTSDNSWGILLPREEFTFSLKIKEAAAMCIDELKKDAEKCTANLRTVASSYTKQLKDVVTCIATQLNQDTPDADRSNRRSNSKSKYHRELSPRRYGFENLQRMCDYLVSSALGETPIKSAPNMSAPISNNVQQTQRDSPLKKEKSTEKAKPAQVASSLSEASNKSVNFQGMLRRGSFAPSYSVPRRRYSAPLSHEMKREIASMKNHAELNQVSNETIEGVDSVSYDADYDNVQIADNNLSKHITSDSKNNLRDETTGNSIENTSKVSSKIPEIIPSSLKRDKRGSEDRKESFNDVKPIYDGNDERKVNEGKLVRNNSDRKQEHVIDVDDDDLEDDNKLICYNNNTVEGLEYKPTSAHVGDQKDITQKRNITNNNRGNTRSTSKITTTEHSVVIKIKESVVDKCLDMSQDEESDMSKHYEIEAPSIREDKKRAKKMGRIQSIAPYRIEEQRARVVTELISNAGILPSKKGVCENRSFRNIPNTKILQSKSENDKKYNIDVRCSKDGCNSEYIDISALSMADQCKGTTTTEQQNNDSEEK